MFKKILTALAIVSTAFFLLVVWFIADPELFLGEGNPKALKIKEEWRDIRENLGFLGEYAYKEFARDNCGEPLAYSIINIDSRFGITDEKVLGLLKDAEEAWEEAVGIDLFVYDPNAKKKVEVDLIYTELQQKLVAERSSNASLDKQWLEYENALLDYENLADLHEKQFLSQEKRIIRYENKIKAYNEKIRQWDLNPGSAGNESEFQKLDKEGRVLDKEFQSISYENSEINANAEQLNLTADTINRWWEELSVKTDIHNNKYVTDVEFDAAIYDGLYNINVYQYTDTSDLRWTLAHEFGHSIGLDHLDSADSIMYYLRNEEQNMAFLKPSVADIAAMKSICDI